MWLSRALRGRSRLLVSTPACGSRLFHLSRAAEAPGNALVRIDSETCPLGAGQFASATIHLADPLQYPAVAKTAWSKVLSSLQGATPSLVVIQWSAFPLPGTSAASSLSRALVSIVNPPGATAAPVPIVGCSGGVWKPLAMSLEQHEADSLRSRSGHDDAKPDVVQLVITAAALPHVSVHAFHCATSAMPPLPNMKEALTTNQPHLLMFGTNSKEAEAMDMWAKLVDRLEMLLPDACIAGLKAKDVWLLEEPVIDVTVTESASSAAVAQEQSASSSAESATPPSTKWESVRFGAAELETEAKRLGAREASSSASLLFENELVRTTGVTGVALSAATRADGGQAQRLTAAQFASVMKFMLSSSEVDSAFFDEKVMRAAFMPHSLSPPLSIKELVRRRRYVHGVRFTGGVVQGLGQDFGQAKAEQQVDGEASGGRATSDSEALQRVVLDYSGVETALEVARVPAGVQREELLLFDLDVTLLPGATSWLSSHSSCQVAEMRIFEPRYRLLFKAMVEAAVRKGGERWGARFGLHTAGVGTAAVVRWFEYAADGTGAGAMGLQGGRRFRVVPGTEYVLPFTFGLWAAQVEYFDDDPLDLDEGTPCTPPGAERAEELEVVNRHAIARVALFVANQLNPLLKHVTAELHPNPHLPPAFMTAALMGQQLQCASLAPNADDIFGKGFVSEAPLHLGEDARASQAEAEAMAAAAAAQAAANPGPPMHTAEWYAAFSNAVAAILPPKRRDATRQRHCWLQETCVRKRLERLRLDLAAFEPHKWVLMSLDPRELNAPSSATSSGSGSPHPAPWEWRKKENVAKLLRNMFSSISSIHDSVTAAEDD